MRKFFKITVKTLIIAVLAFVFVSGLLYRFDEEQKVKKYSDYIEKYSEEYSVEERLVKAVIKTESGFDEKAVSQKGACGLMQLTPSTFRYANNLFEDERIAVEDDDIFVPEKNIKTGCKYLRYLRKIFVTDVEVLCAYNAGEGRVKSWLANDEYSSDGKTLKKIPYKETYDFVKKVTFYTKIY